MYGLNKPNYSHIISYNGRLILTKFAIFSTINLS